MISDHTIKFLTARNTTLVVSRSCYDGNAGFQPLKNKAARMAALQMNYTAPLIPVPI